MANLGCLLVYMQMKEGALDIYTKYWSNSPTASLGHAVYNACSSVASKNGLANRGLKAGDLYVLRETNNRTVLLELGFVDNKKGCRFNVECFL
ncbi:N-acetylmuramoyl-L-alanine amidase [endosymbiont 'TC1' of Trimyema compressum]|uniref:N-acetylmuramoyl-L-alanine amidase n=1 Tax=endosymbiont 'TC1' of Trimyema compressum TaxID=243899 RepID=UPI00139233E4|nr:N-acetylmuramoyl-L-alanine amidase [endosymbiont 'TC1' of Trimyema compressum]